MCGTLSKIQSFESNSIRKIRVMASQADPYVSYDEKSLKGLDIDIIDNFAMEFHMQVEYSITNETLKEVFSSEIRFDNFLQSAPNS